MNNEMINFLFQMVFQGQNPNLVAQQIISQNPQAQILFNQMKQSGMSMKDFTLQYAKQNNVNINPLVNMFNQKGIKF